MVKLLIAIYQVVELEIDKLGKCCSSEFVKQTFKSLVLSECKLSKAKLKDEWFK